MPNETISIPRTVGIIGGTGPAGRAFAARLAGAGIDVAIGSRSVEKAQEATSKVLERWPDESLSIRAVTNEEAALAELVVVATPWAAAASTAAACADALRGKVVISMANAITMIEGELQPVIPARGSISAGVQSAIPGSYVVGAMHHVPAHELGDLRRPVGCDVLVCADDPGARASVISLLSQLDGLRPVDAGGLSNAAAIEAMTAVLLGVNSRYGTRTTIRLVGLPG